MVELDAFLHVGARRRGRPGIFAADIERAFPSIDHEYMRRLMHLLHIPAWLSAAAERAFTRVLHPLRALLKADAVFPPNAEQKKAIDAIKDLLVEEHQLAVPDEHAAVLASAAWLEGRPPEGRPYELGADTSKIAMGGVVGQCAADNGKLRVLMYWSAPLSPSQSPDSGHSP